ncbi:MAG: thiol-disulfide oxidoreductase DCC family protein [Bacteroidota bacterium]|nr:thiol-disulfide oxidoreductase DCC family protein [Bacteroidota bacterium]MDP4244678.1 thiol-disulfide oxidoreductase DCC family protein [Bacteroidota bacterium]MDP4253268.1 thiol-disulfide oxidoreductase DCC family protein [Bacteroidota bacterium]MDP4256889.1 thiol-disulfide oxidoreductase DCC family protein [Bacteroidota bacterium]
MTGPVLFFDGVCNLCNRSVQFVLKHDKAGKFRFASLQSVAGQDLLKKAGSAPGMYFDSFVLLESGKLYTRSMAALRVLKGLGGPWALLYVFRFIPAFIRDGLYNWIARNRYRWFGRRDECSVPSAEWEGRFLS